MPVLKLNLVNKIYAGISLVLITAIVCKLLGYQPWNRYYYSANVCMPATFPVTVKEIYFMTAAAKEHVYVASEAVDNFTSNWGTDDYFSETNEQNLLPEKLLLKYADYREGTFFNDTIILPTQKIKKIFEASLKNNTAEDIYYKGQQKPGLCFLVGIANNGNIIVWLRDKKQEYEVLRMKIHAKMPTAEDTYYSGPLSKEAYLENRFRHLDDSLKILIRSGFDANANYIDSSSGY